MKLYDELKDKRGHPVGAPIVVLAVPPMTLRTSTIDTTLGELRRHTSSSVRVTFGATPLTPGITGLIGPRGPSSTL